MHASTSGSRCFGLERSIAGQLGARRQRASSTWRQVSTPTASVPHAESGPATVTTSAKMPDPAHFRTIAIHRYYGGHGGSNILTNGHGVDWLGDRRDGSRRRAREPDAP